MRHFLIAGFVLLFAIAQIVASFLPQQLGWSSSIVERSAQNQTAATPLRPTFAIWALIFLSSLAFATYGFFVKQNEATLWRRVALIAASVFALNTLWELYVPLQNLDWISFAIIAAAAFLANLAVFRIANWPAVLTSAERWLVAIPLQIFAGWLTAATFVGLPSVLAWANVSIIDPRADATAILVVIGLTIVTCGVICKTRAWPYAATVCWAISGVVASNIYREDRPAIVIAAIFSGLIVVCITAFALHRKAAKTTNGDSF